MWLTSSIFFDCGFRLSALTAEIMQRCCFWHDEQATRKKPYHVYPRYYDVILPDLVKDFADEIIS